MKCQNDNRALPPYQPPSLPTSLPHTHTLSISFSLSHSLPFHSLSHTHTHFSLFAFNAPLPPFTFFRSGKPVRSFFLVLFFLHLKQGSFNKNLSFLGFFIANMQAIINKSLSKLKLLNLKTIFDEKRYNCVIFE